MGFKRRTATTGKLAIPEGARKEAVLIYLHKIVSVVEKHRDQTPSKYVQASRHTMPKKGVSTVEIVGSGDKRSITATFVISQMARSYPCN